MKSLAPAGRISNAGGSRVLNQRRGTIGARVRRPLGTRRPGAALPSPQGTLHIVVHRHSSRPTGRPGSIAHFDRPWSPDRRRPTPTLRGMLLLAALLHVAVGELTGWTGSTFPDVRGPSVDQCGEHIPRDTGYLPYVCDPDKVLNRSESKYSMRSARICREPSDYCSCAH